jgi:hypothetical protein
MEELTNIQIIWNSQEDIANEEIPSSQDDVSREQIECLKEKIRNGYIPKILSHESNISKMPNVRYFLMAMEIL